MTLAKIRSRFKLYGYGLKCFQKCHIDGKVYRYATYPLSLGAWGFFDTLAQLETYLSEIENMRRIYAELEDSDV